MPARLSLDLAKFDLDLDADLRALSDGLEQGLDKAGARTVQVKQRLQNQRTYSRPERIGPNGQKEWERTGAWLNGQEVQRTGQFERTVTTVGDAAAYESRLANLPTGPDGINRTNNASRDTTVIVEPQLGPLVDDGVREELRRRGVPGN